ncbi:hypothetical protein [Lactovum odontotermitis]
MLAVKDITGKFTPKYAEAIRPFTEWLLQYGYDYNYKNGTFTIKFTADAGFDAVKVAADEIDNQFELQGDLFDSSPEDVTNELELLEGEFEEMKIPMTELTDPEQVGYDKFCEMTTRDTFDGGQYTYQVGGKENDCQKKRRSYLEYLETKKHNFELPEPKEKKFEIKIQDGGLLVEIKNYSQSEAVHTLAHALIGICDEEPDTAMLAVMVEIERAAQEGKSKDK